MTGSSRWAQVAPAHVPGVRFTACLVADPTSGAPLLFTQGAGVWQRELWTGTGEGSTDATTGIFPSHVRGEDLFGVFAAADRSDVVLFGRRKDGVVLTRRSEPGTERVLLFEDSRTKSVFAAGWWDDEWVFVATDGTVL